MYPLLLEFQFIECVRRGDETYCIVINNKVSKRKIFVAHLDKNDGLFKVTQQIEMPGENTCKL